MPTTNSTPANPQIEQIFNEVNQKLEDLISRNRNLLISTDDDDPARENLFAFCIELEGLRKKITNPNEVLSIRIESVGNVAQYIKDLIQDISDDKNQATANTLSNEVMNVLTSIETTIGMISKESTVIEDNILKTPEDQTENYFQKKQAELKKLAAERPAR